MNYFYILQYLFLRLVLCFQKQTVLTLFGYFFSDSAS